MRLFISIELPGTLKDDLYKFQNYVPNNLAKVNWVAKKNIHVTLKFLGNVDEDKLKEVKLRLSKIKFKPFKLKINEVGFSKMRNKLAVIRLDFENDSELVKLQQEIDQELLDIFKEDQKFVPHLTLGRIKQIKKEKEFVEKVNSYEFKKEDFLVNEFELIQSKLTKDGPKYKSLEVFKA